MKNLIYLYYYDDYLHILDYIHSFNNSKKFVYNHYDKYELNFYNSSANIFLYKDIKLIAVSCNRYKDIRFLDILKFSRKVNLLDKSIFNNLFNTKFSQNLCKLVIDIDILGDDEEIIEFNGYKLSESGLLEDFEINDINSLTKLKSYSIQPYGYKYLINIKSTNKLEFSKKFTESEIEEILSKLISLISSTMSGGEYY